MWEADTCSGLKTFTTLNFLLRLQQMYVFNVSFLCHCPLQQQEQNLQINDIYLVSLYVWCHVKMKSPTHGLRGALFLNFHTIALFRLGWLYFRFSLQLKFQFVPKKKSPTHIHTSRWRKNHAMAMREFCKVLSTPPLSQCCNNVALF